MASLSDIDTKGSVSKYLFRETVQSRQNETANQGDEIESLLESVAIAFLLAPQTILNILVRAKNSLQQVAAAEILVVDYLRSSLKDITNPSDKIDDVSDLTEAQTALVELDRLGRLGDVQPFSRYNAAIERFLDAKLSRNLKKHNRREFERSGAEARQDLFTTLSTFPSLHQVLIDRLAFLARAVTDFESVDLTRIVSTKTVARVRSSVRQIKRGLEDGGMSQTVAAIELLSGAAALKSVSNLKKVYDPAIQTGTLPAARTITISAEPVAATILSAQGPFDLSAIATPWSFSVSVFSGGSTYNATKELPATGASGAPYILSTSLPANVTIAAGAKLYLRIEASPGSFIDAAIPLPAGTSPFATVLAAIEADLQLFDPGYHAVELTAGSRRILIYTAGGESLSVRQMLSDGTNTGPDASESLGFTPFQGSRPVGVFPVEHMLELLSAHFDTSRVTFRDERDSLGQRIRATVAGAATAAGPANTIAITAPAPLGFGSAVAEPTYLELVENAAALEPRSAGVFLGSLVSCQDGLGRSLLARVTGIDGTRLSFPAGPLPRCLASNVTVTAQIVVSTRDLLAALAPRVGTFDSDASRTFRALTPALAKSPTKAQLSDADDHLVELRGRLVALKELLEQTVISTSETEFESNASDVLSGLEERGADRAADLLRQGRFSEFFSLSKDSASRGTRFLKSIEEIGRNELSESTVEADISDEHEPVSSSPEDDVLPDIEPSE